MKPRFLADCNVGRLARWLRALGYDASYHARIDDGELVRAARAGDGNTIRTLKGGRGERRSVPTPGARR